jgi:hypothetical protein
LVCPRRKEGNGSAAEPGECELNSIRHDPDRVAEIRNRLSNISWWMRVLCQTIAIRANREDGESGKFWQSRYRAVRLMDEEALLACAAYVDLNPIRAALAETLEGSDHTSVQRRIEALRERTRSEQEDHAPSSEIGAAASMGVVSSEPLSTADQFLSPLELEERHAEGDACSRQKAARCSDKGFLAMSEVEYLELLDWTARQTARGKRGSTPADAPPVLTRLRLSPAMWCELVTDFGRLFSTVAGHPRTVDGARSHLRRRRFHLTRRVRELLSVGK